MKHYKYLFYIILLLIAFTNCKKEEEQEFPVSEFISTGSYAGEYWPTDGWRTCKPEDVGMNEDKLIELHNEINLLLEMHIDLHNIIIVKDGYIVAEQYYSDDYDMNDLHRIYSCTKSISSALIGIAIQQNYISDVNEKMMGRIFQLSPYNPN